MYVLRCLFVEPSIKNTTRKRYKIRWLRATKSPKRVWSLLLFCFFTYIAFLCVKFFLLAHIFISGSLFSYRITIKNLLRTNVALKNYTRLYVYDASNHPLSHSNVISNPLDSVMVDRNRTVPQPKQLGITHIYRHLVHLQTQKVLNI